MNEKGLVEKDDLQVLKRTIKEEMPEWLETLRRFCAISNLRCSRLNHGVRC